MSEKALPAAVNPESGGGSGEGAGPASESGSARLAVAVSYAGTSTLTPDGQGGSLLDLIADGRRPAVRLEATLKEPLRIREALASLQAIVASDYRYVPKDRTAYLAYLRMRRESSGLNVWQAQHAYFSWLAANDPMALAILDPVITVHPDELIFEVFSKDEGSYAQLVLNQSGFEATAPPVCGTTNIDFSQPLNVGIQQMRGYRTTRLHIGSEQVELTTTQAKPVLEKTIQVPDSWLRGFLQVQSAATLPMEEAVLDPVDLYNVLRHLRMNGDRKGKRRGIRVELVPGEAPRLVLEPWETVITGTAAPYRGRSARVIRLWGRRRLSLLARFLPLTQHVSIHLLGSGLPSFWVLRGKEMTLTLGLTGFTASNWSQAVNFDLILPRHTEASPTLDAVLKSLQSTWKATPEELSASTGLALPLIRSALQTGCQAGQVMYDLAAKTYRLRPLLAKPIDAHRLEYRSAGERIAHDLIARRQAVKIESESRVSSTSAGASAGLEIVGKVAVREDDREYRPVLVIDEEGMVVKAECTCPAFRKNGLKAGPCPHLVALRLAYAARKSQAQASTDGPVHETRTYSRRDAQGEQVYQLILDQKRLRVRWGRAGAASRLITLAFDSPEAARAAYGKRAADLDRLGYLDATAG